MRDCTSRITFHGSLRTLSRALSGLQLFDLLGNFAIVDVDAVHLGEGLERLIEFAHFFVAESNLESQRLVLVLWSAGDLETTFEPHYRDFVHLFALEAHAQHVATVYVVALESLHPRGSESHLELRDR